MNLGVVRWQDLDVGKLRFEKLQRSPEFQTLSDVISCDFKLEIGIMSFYSS